MNSRENQKESVTTKEESIRAMRKAILRIEERKSSRTLFFEQKVLAANTLNKKA